MTKKSIEKLKLQMREIAKRLFGMNDILKIYCLSKAADLSALLIGPHGVAKSSLCRLWSQTCGLDFRIVTSHEVDDSLIAYPDIPTLRAENIIKMKRGELMTREHILIDEWFLWNNRYRARLHQLMEEGTYSGLTVLTKTYSLASNPLTEYFAGQIPEVNMATSDRIDLQIPVYEPKIVSSQRMIRKFSAHGRKEPDLSKVIAWHDYLGIRAEILDVSVPPKMIVWLSLFAEELSCCKFTSSKFNLSKARMRLLCKECNRIESICSRVACSKPRFIRSTILLSKALSWYEGRASLNYNDILESIKFTLPHRLALLKEEETLESTEKEIVHLVSAFNEHILMIENKNVLKDLEEINTVARDKINPRMLEDKIAALLLELQEDLPFLNYAKELIEYSKRRVKRFYETKAKAVKPLGLGKFRDELDQSGLDIYIKKEILEVVQENKADLTVKYPLNMNDLLLGLKPELDSKEKVVKMILALHPRRKEPNLKTLLKDKMVFNSKKMDISEDIDGRHLNIVCANEKTKGKVEELLKKGEE